MKQMQPHDRIICALDMTDPARAFALVKQLDGLVSFYKVGMLLHLAGGSDLVRRMVDQGYRIFLDLKFYDVPDTVHRVVEYTAGLGVHLLTVHGNKEILIRAAEAAAGSDLQVLAVTALTSLDETDIKGMGFPCSVEELVLQRARWAIECGCAGVIASPREVSRIRDALGSDMLIVTPGIRPEGSARGTHKRAAAPGAAVRDGADYLVIGQPIINAPDPRQAVEDIILEIKD